MRTLLFSSIILLFLAAPSRAQFGSFGDVPIEITAEGETRFEGGVAYAEDNVLIQYGDTTIRADYAQYNPETREVLVRGNVQIFRDGVVFTGERGIYNFETKVFTAADFRGDAYPLYYAAESVSTIEPGEIRAQDTIFTTSDSSIPDYHVRAKSVRIYPDDRVVFHNVTMYVGRTPVFWWPYLYQSLRKDSGFTITPGYLNIWGAFALTQYKFPINENMYGQVRLDYRSKRGLAVGFDSEFRYGKENRSWGTFSSYYLQDQDASINRTGLSRQPIDSTRYRVSLEHRLYVTDDIYANIDIDKLSDERLLQDFFPEEFRLHPQTDNVVSLTKWHPNFTITAIARAQLNEFFNTTERLPELVLDVKRQPLFGSNFFYEGETGVAFLRRNFAEGLDFPDYDATRFDSFHKILYPRTYFGWLSVIPSAGFRGTYYSDSGRVADRIVELTFEDLLGDDPRLREPAARELEGNGSVFRPIFTAGLESSFKFSRTFETVQSRMWGLDGLRHIVQPYTNFSYVYSGEDPAGLLQFDRLNPSTRIPPIDFPQFNSIDSIPDWTILRTGVRNRLQTRRGNSTFNWVELDTFFDTNIDEPDYPGTDFDEGTFSNVYNNLRFNPLPWVSLQVDSQLPLLDSGFTEVNTTLSFLLNRSTKLHIGHRFIDSNPFFEDSNLIHFGGYYRLNEHWSFSLREQFEMDDNVLEAQRYEIHRDLSSWIASLGVLVRDNRGASEYAVLLTFTLKDLPQVALPFAFDPTGEAGE